ncbi:MAG: ribosome silencing factor [Cellvibrionales bacterium TMED148]|nr:ribosome silencing factor [Porticoccaceae bacterium]RPG93881.1 MAG: ribosome silencing factor [Cellvibrionales bacterium TMED148]
MSEHLKNIIISALEDIKAVDVVTISVSSLTDVMDTLIIASGNSHRQVKALANNVLSEAKDAGFSPIGVEGENSREWILIDFGDIVTNIMLPSSREFYDLDRLWLVRPENKKGFAEGKFSDCQKGDICN